MKTKIIGISDVSVGYGSPQIPELIKYLKQTYNDSECLLIEPDQLDKPYKRDMFSEFNIKRVLTRSDPYSSQGRIEYILKASETVNIEKPNVLVIFCTYSLPVLFKLKKRPEYVIYYNIESASAYGNFDLRMNAKIDKLVDLLIYPEENRLRRDIELRGYKNIPGIILYNCVNGQENEKLIPVNERNGRIIYSGTIDADTTFARYYLGDEVQDFPIDLYGKIGGSSSECIIENYSKLCGKVRYMGYLSGKILKTERKRYIYSIIMWNPSNDNQYYAAPNKFFEAIADGVPPIAAPHPQCKKIIEKYNCGVLMKDWSYDSFVDALQTAMRLYYTGTYKNMVNNCLKAVREELNWEYQVEKIKPHLWRN